MGTAPPDYEPQIVTWVDDFIAADTARRGAMMTQVAWRVQTFLKTLIRVADRKLGGDLAATEDFLSLAVIAVVPPSGRASAVATIVSEISSLENANWHDHEAGAIEACLRRVLDRVAASTYADEPPPPHPFAVDEPKTTK